VLYGSENKRLHEFIYTLALFYRIGKTSTEPSCLELFAISNRGRKLVYNIIQQHLSLLYISVKFGHKVLTLY
ncbi:hypothetical protein, partial [Methylobacter sp.]|uniref:hypothetical protein n=1 Tax=Methylobacter sp. TaxID=2051955 RepID=UPI002487FB83